MAKCLVLTSMLLTFATGVLLAQEKASSVVPCAFTYAYREQGWEIPGTQAAEPLGPRMNLVIKEKATDVFVTRLKPPTQPVTVLVPFCSSNHPGRLELPMQPLRVKEIWKYDVGGRVFAYGVSAGWTGFDSAGKMVAIGRESNLVFIDEVGDGKFRSLRFTSFPFKVEKPQWLKKE